MAARLAAGGARRWLAAALLVVAVLAPYHAVVTGRAIPIPDDVAASDLADGEFPVRVEAGRIAAGGEWPVWTPRLLTGLPMIVDPLSVGLFAALPPALALGLLLGLFLSAAALGMYVLARRMGASRSGAFLSGFAFAWSGFFVCQLRHLGILGTVALFPWAVYCIERAAARALPVRARLLWLVAFGAVFGLQCLATFPQSAYIAALFYVALVGFRALWLLELKGRLPWRWARLAPASALALGACAAMVAGALVGMAVLLPLHELGQVSDRQGGGTYEWATQFKYYVGNWKTFFVPYINGDISNLSYTQSNIFWEDYGYVGLITTLAAFGAIALGVRGLVARRAAAGENASEAGPRLFAIAFWAVAGAVAYGLVLGPATPLYRFAHEFLPGLKLFRFPTRFLFVVEFALALLGGLGITYLQAFIASRVPAGRRAFMPALVGAVLVSITVADLVWYNRRQNPLIDSQLWLSPPATAVFIHKSGEPGRVYSPGSRKSHRDAFYEARGWSGDLTPYFLQRGFLQPNANLLHGLPCLDAYSGISPEWALGWLGDHCHRGALEYLGVPNPKTPAVYYDWLAALSVRWLLLSHPAETNRLEWAGSTANVNVYRMRDALPRARFAASVRPVASAAEAAKLSAEGKLDPRNEAVLDRPGDAERLGAVPAAAKGSARIVVDRAGEVVIETQSPTGGLLVLADTYYPGWVATVDGLARPILRANLMHRGVVVPAGEHRVAFTFRSRSVRWGLLLSAAGVALLGGAVLLLALGGRRLKS